MGLMPRPGAPAPGGEAPTQAPPADPARDPSRFTDEGDNGVTPEEQEQYSKFEENYMRLIYDPKGEVIPGILEALQPGNAQAEQAGDQAEADGNESIGSVPPPIMSLAFTAVQIVTKLDDSARKAGQPLSDDVLMQGGTAVIEELVEVSEAAGLHDYSEQDMAGALTVAMDMYRPKAIADGRTDEETLKGQWGEVVQADQEGRLGEVVPELAQQPEQQQPPAAA